MFGGVLNTPLRIKGTVMQIEKALVNDQKYPEDFAFQLFIILLFY